MTKKRGDDEYERFQELTNALLSVPHSEIQRRETDYKKLAAKNPHKRGPKPRKAK